MAGKLSKSDYEKALSAEYGHPVFLRDEEYERLSRGKPSGEKAKINQLGEYQDPFAYLDDDKDARAAATKARLAKPEAWTTAPGQTYNKVNNRTPKGARYAGFEGDAPKNPGMSALSDQPKAAPPVLAGVPSPNASAKKPEAPASSKIEKIQAPEAPTAKPTWGPALTAETSMPVGVEYLNGVDPNPYVEDLGNDPGGTSMEEKLAAQQQYEMLKAADDIGALPTTFKTAPVYAPKSMLPQWQSDEEEVNSMLNRYAALGK